MLEKAHADRIAIAIALLAVAVAAVVVANQGPEFAPPRTTRTVEQSTAAAGGSARGSETTTTTEVGSRSFVERMLGRGGIVLLAIAAVLLTGFVAGAFAQRVLMGDFALKFGPLELKAVQVKAEQTFVDLTASVAGLGKSHAEQKRDIEHVATQMSDVSMGVVSLGTVVSELNERIKGLEDEKGEP